MDSATLSFSANVQIADTIRAFTPAQPGTVFITDDELRFLEDGESEPITLRLIDIREASVGTHLLGVDDVLIVPDSGPAWNIRTGSSDELVEALRARNVVLK